MKISYSSVVGDLFHYGNLQSLQFAKSISDYNICGVLTDKAVEQNRGKPIASLSERKAVFEQLKCVDLVIVQDSTDPTDNLKSVHKEFPDAEIILVHGTDWKRLPGAEYIESIKGKIVRHPYYLRLSNTRIINKIIENRYNFKDIIDFTSLINNPVKVQNKIIISTKANTLQKLKPILTKSKIEKMLVFNVSAWKTNEEGIINKILNKFSSDNLIIRSSAVMEDNIDSSMAGYFTSVLNVRPEHDKIRQSVRKVIESYKAKNSESSFNQVLVQTYTKNIMMSGVVFSRSLDTDKPYYIINYDTKSGKTDTVTKGIGQQTIKILRKSDIKKVPSPFNILIDSVKEIENIISSVALDIEFAITKDNQVVIFQVRPLTTSEAQSKQTDVMVYNKIQQIKQDLRKSEHLSIIFADMPDWNPAEIIGDNPNLLDCSLYHTIITDNIWHEARTSQGYTTVNDKLVYLIGNKPYINVNNSFLSFIPDDVPEKIKQKLLRFYLSKLKRNPQLQDKVEFEILYTCYDLTFNKRINELNFSKAEIGILKNSLIRLTNRLVNIDNIVNDIKYIAVMEHERLRIIKSEQDPIKRFECLIQNCKQNGTIQFSRLARLAFIGKIMLKSMVSQKIISEEMYDHFMCSIHTVASMINDDFNRLTKSRFIRKYYHLRPGSYDITSKRYIDNKEIFNNFPAHKSTKKSKFNLFMHDKINKVLNQHGLTFDMAYLLKFTKMALEARELSKFEFSKSLSDAIEELAIIGEQKGITRYELAMLEIEDILNINKKGARWLQNIIMRKQTEREINNQLILPEIITSPDDVEIIRNYTPKPNFITQKKVIGYAVHLKKHENDIKNKIVLLENGDPGYDWIFTMNILALITKYGGIASHMAIRCAEFGIPSAIGCGAIFDKLADNSRISLDCKNKKIDLVR